MPSPSARALAPAARALATTTANTTTDARETEAAWQDDSTLPYHSHLSLKGAADPLIIDQARASDGVSCGGSAVGAWVGSRPDIEIEGNQLDGAVGTELSDDGVDANEHAGRDQDPIVVATGYQRRQLLEARWETLDDVEQFEGLEVVRGRLAVRSAFVAELSSKVLEKLADARISLRSALTLGWSMRSWR